jgi:pimeloyl-ACP methyl ester carboxylesterase
MHHGYIAAFHRLLMAALAAATTSMQPAFAQMHGDTAEYVSASYAPKYSRYYAPYAIQAAAAYTDVASFNATRASPQQPSLDASDVRLAVASLGGDAAVTEAATKYLQSWQYQFGSEGYLTCFESDPECLQKIRKDRFTFAIGGGPAFHVWARTRATQRAGAACSEVSIAFRGSTPATADWISNAAPVTGYVADDYYRQLRRNIDAVIKKITTLDCYRRAKTQIVTVGHSLGAGLAQFSPLAANPARPRITKVFAFDPSPVTGASYVDAAVRSQNANVEIDIIYQNKEALEQLRSIQQRARSLLRMAEPARPCVRTVVYDVFLPAGSVALHNMPGLAREMVGMTYDGAAQKPYVLPKSHANCPSQYQAPRTDEDDNPALVAGSAAKVAAANSGSTARRVAMADGMISRAALPTEINRPHGRLLRQRAIINAKRPESERAVGVPVSAHKDGDMALPPG